MSDQDFKEDHVFDPRALLVSGFAMDVADPIPHQYLDLLSVSQGLALCNRYAGQMRYPYSVAQHSVALCLSVPNEMRRYALVHDVPEFILGDKIRPVKSLLPDYKALEHKHSVAMQTAYGVERVEGFYDYDSQITIDELLAIQPGQNWAEVFQTDPLGVEPQLLAPWSHSLARDMWLQLMWEHFPELQGHVEIARMTLTDWGDTPSPLLDGELYIQGEML